MTLTTSTNKKTDTVVNLEYNGATCYMSGDIPVELKFNLAQTLTYIDSNAEYQRSRQLKLKGYSNIDSRRCLYKYTNKVGSFPTGLIPRVYQVLVNNGCEVNVTRRVRNLAPSTVELPDYLYSYQKQVIKVAIEACRGLIQAPTGSGKTLMIAYYIAHFPTARIIVLENTKDLIKQTATELKQALNIPIGLYYGDKKNWERVTVGTPNSLCRLGDVNPKAFADVDIIIYDEVHLYNNATTQKFSNLCTGTSYRLGLSATIDLDASESLKLYGMVGPHLLTVKEETLVKEGLLTKPKYIYIDMPDPGDLMEDGTDRYKGKYLDPNSGVYIYNTHNKKPARAEVYKHCIVNNKERNTAIVSLLEAFLKSKRFTGPAFVLVESLEHGEQISRLAGERGINLPFISGDDNSATRDSVVKGMRSGEFRAICATRIFNQGTNIKPLELVIIASGGNDKKRIAQQVGRVVRKSPETEKVEAISIDFRDNEKYYLQWNFNNRLEEINKRFPDCSTHMTYEEAILFLTKSSI
jgi:superfamily II DNA or RNA helicase